MEMWSARFVEADHFPQSTVAISSKGNLESAILPSLLFPQGETGSRSIPARFQIFRIRRLGEDGSLR
jgi:hypothetical protein